MPAVKFELWLLYGSVINIRGEGLDEPQKVMTGTAFINMSFETSDGRDAMTSPVVFTVHTKVHMSNTLLPNTGRFLRH